MSALVLAAAGTAALLGAAVAVLWLSHLANRRAMRSYRSLHHAGRPLHQRTQEHYQGWPKGMLR